MLFNKGAFAQVLEGSRRAIEDTFERIQRDERHGEVTVLQCGPTPERKFGNWSMAFVGHSARGQQLWNKLAEQSGFDTSRMEGDAVFSMLHGLVLEEEGLANALASASNTGTSIERSTSLDTDQIRAELAELRPDQAPGPLPTNERGVSSSSVKASPPPRTDKDNSAIALLKAALASERQRTTDLRNEIDEFQIALASREDSILAMTRERDAWAERARLLALAIGDKVDALCRVSDGVKRQITKPDDGPAWRAA